MTTHTRYISALKLFGFYEGFKNVLYLFSVTAIYLDIVFSGQTQTKATERGHICIW